MKETVLRSDALLMRPLEADDADDILALATAKSIVENTFVPAPYPPEAAHEFVRKSQDLWSDGEACVFGIVEAGSQRFAGCMGLHPVLEHSRAEVGYWIGEPFQGRGLATVALSLLIQFGFESLKLNRIEAGHFAGNIASGRVMQKAGMRFEGIRRGAAWHRDRFKDLHWYALLREDYVAQKSSQTKGTAED